MPNAKPFLRSLLVAGTLALSAPAGAACTAGTSGVAFGTYSPSVGDNSTGTIEVTCGLFDGQPTVAIGAGTSGNFHARQMRSGPHQLAYGLYTDAGRTSIWGDGSQGTSTVSMANPQWLLLWLRYTRSIYGHIPAGQHVAAGSYTDTILVTVIF